MIILSKINNNNICVPDWVSLVLFSYYVFVLLLSILHFMYFPILATSFISCILFYFLIPIYTMQKSTVTTQKKNARNHISSTTREWKAYSYQSDHGINTIKDRWLYVKTQVIRSDLSQIMTITRESKKSQSKKLKIYKQIAKLLSVIHSKTKDPKYMEIIQVITKYLNSIRNFLSNVDRQSFCAYTVLFESTMIAITRDISYLE